MGPSARVVAFIAMMGALGNALFMLSQFVFTMGQVALDLSHIATFISALYGGPELGTLVGILVGIGTGFYFGFVGGSLGLPGLLGLVAGKAMTGFTAGVISSFLRKNKGFQTLSSRKVAILIPISYIPECLFTVAFFLALVPLFFPPDKAAFFASLLAPILIKAWIEIGFMAALMGALAGNKGFLDFVEKFLRPRTGKKKEVKRLSASISARTVLLR